MPGQSIRAFVRRAGSRSNIATMTPSSTHRTRRGSNPSSQESVAAITHHFLPQIRWLAGIRP
jgi:hypothetical protein